MAIDLVSLVSQVLTPQVVARIASALGISPAVVQKLVDATVPAVLASLGGVAATPGGAQKISDAVSNQDSNLLDNLVKALGGAGQADLANAGSQALGSLLGGQAPGAIAGALAKHTSADPKAAGSVLGLVTHAVTGTLAQQDPDNWSDGGAVAKLFEGQKGAIAAAMPMGLSDALAPTGLLKGLEGVLQRAAPAAATAASATPPPAPSMSAAAGTTGTASGGLPGWVWIIVAVVVIAALAWLFFFRHTS